MSSANSLQIGGDHYKTRMEHWDFVELNGIGYLEGCASKYITRWKKKNGLEDLKKALHYIDKTIELAQANRKSPPRMNRLPSHALPVNEFAAANGLGQRETFAIQLVCDWDDVRDLEAAKKIVNELIEELTMKAQGVEFPKG